MESFLWPLSSPAFNHKAKKKRSWHSDLPYPTYCVSAAQNSNKEAQSRQRRKVRESQYFCTEYTDSQLICVCEVPPEDREVVFVFKFQVADRCPCSTTESGVLLLYNSHFLISYLTPSTRRKVAQSPATLNTYIGLCVHQSPTLCFKLGKAGKIFLICFPSTSHSNTLQHS